MHSVREAFFKIRGIASAWISNQQSQDASEAMGQVTAALLDTDTSDELVTISVDGGSPAEQIAATMRWVNDHAAAAVDASIANPPTKLAGLLSKPKDIAAHLQDMIEQAVHRPGECVWAEGLAAGGSIRNQQTYNLAEADIGKLNHRRDAFLVIDTMNALPELLARLRSAEGGERSADAEVVRLQERLEAQIITHNEMIDAWHAERDQLQLGTAAADVLAERRRQIKVEGRSLDHDDLYIKGELSAAAGSYALHAHEDAASLQGAPAWWPWDDAWFKLSNPRRNLVKAGAMILAEIERLDRLAAKATDLAPEAGLPEGLSWEGAPEWARVLVEGVGGDREIKTRLLLWLPKIGTVDELVQGELAADFDSRKKGEQASAKFVEGHAWEVLATRPVPAADGWTAWDGSDELPSGLEPGQMVWVRLGETGAERPGTADRWTWGWGKADHRGFGRIVAYRLTQPDSAAS